MKMLSELATKQDIEIALIRIKSDLKILKWSMAILVFGVLLLVII